MSWLDRHDALLTRLGWVFALLSVAYIAGSVALR